MIKSIRSVPMGWEVRRLKDLARFNPDALAEDTPGDRPFRYVDISGVDELGRIIGWEETVFEKAPSRARRLVCPQDIVVSTVRTYLRAIALVPGDSSDLVFSTGFAVLRPRRDTVHPQFLWRVLQAEPNVQWVVAHSEGIGYPAINPNELGQLRVAVPSMSEQGAIAAFLDRETGKLDALIAKKERLLALLEEKRTALITRAVTKGLDPAVPMKDSGVEWLGEVPAHWEVLPLRDLFRQRNLRGLPDLPLLEVSLTSGVTIREFSSDRIERTANDPASYKVAIRGDIAFNKMRMWQGAVGVAPTDGLVSPDYVVARPRDGVNPHFFEEVFRTISFKTEVYRFSHGIHDDRNRLYWEDFKPLRVPVPPSLEQDQIEEAARRQSEQVRTLGCRVRNVIALLREYRTALISAAVTGRIDVSSGGGRSRDQHLLRPREEVEPSSER